ncbi:hypothetical protein EON65_30030 [archaeon]|nr:MAG: hypothetical protein EON65_30030 [archaeon]
MMSTVLALLLLLYIVLTYSKEGEPKIKQYRPIRVGIAVDDHTRRDISLLVNSVVTAVHNKTDLVFHILACGKNPVASRRLKIDIEETLLACFRGIQFDIVAFTLPPDSGFAAQLTAPRVKKSHWNSATGADMARFYLASVFSTVERILYLDNDVTVSCCIEEIFDSDLEGKVVGIALDDLKWAGWTQFQRHYNAMHPLVVNNMRRNYTAYQKSLYPGQEVTKEEFVRLVPRYPNDGVLLIDVKKFNSLGVLQDMNHIARANAEDQYVIGIGTQQFTVLTLHDRWKEISPRANLRHFPDMARGFMMWFFYNGFLHYAGASKPRSLCQFNTFKDSNWHRVQSFTPWLISHYQMSAKCPTYTYIAPYCNRHLLLSRNVFSTYKILLTIISTLGSDRQLVYLKIGGSLPVLQKADHERDLTFILKSFSTLSRVYVDGNSTQIDCGKALHLGVESIAMTHIIDRMVSFTTQWDVRVFVSNQTNSSLQTDAQEKLSVLGNSYRDVSTFKLPFSSKEDTQRQLKTVRRLEVVQGEWCKKYTPSRVYMPRTELDYFDSNGKACQSVLLHLKANGYKHWEPVVISVQEDSNIDTIATLLALDLIFMRPKLIIVALNPKVGLKTLSMQLEEVRGFLERVGFVVGESVSLDCYEDSAPPTVYIWGVRMNDLEFL